jgi:hypothetical protein
MHEIHRGKSTPRWAWTKYLIPHVAIADLPAMVVIALSGGLIAGAFGAVHDLWTFSISREYFTKVKFKSFAYANLGLGDQVFSACVGFLAAGIVGLFAAWFLARRFYIRESSRVSSIQIARGFLFIFVCTIIADGLGYAYGLWRGPDADYSAWFWAIEKYQIEDRYNFVRVAYIHNSAYMGGGTGFLLALIRLKSVQMSNDSIRA